MKVGDASGQITCVFWDDMADTVARESLTPGSSVRLLHGYTKQGMCGEVEFHLGSRASFQILKRSSSETFTEAAVTPAGNFLASDQRRLRRLKSQRRRAQKERARAL